MKSLIFYQLLFSCGVACLRIGVEPAPSFRLFTMENCQDTDVLPKETDSKS